MPATPSPPVAPSSAQASAGSDHIQVGSRPDSDFAWRRVASPSPLPSCPCLATPSPPGAPSAAQAGDRPDPTPEWASGPTRASPGGERLRPLLRRSALIWRRPRRLARLQPHSLAMGPQRVGSRPDPGVVGQGGAARVPYACAICQRLASLRGQSPPQPRHSALAQRLLPSPSPPGAPRPRRRAQGQNPLPQPSQFFGQGAFGPHSLSLYINTRLAAS